jgi:hypothetical protein
MIKPEAYSAVVMLQAPEAHQNDLTPFALERLREFVKSRKTGSE